MNFLKRVKEILVARAGTRDAVVLVHAVNVDVLKDEVAALALMADGSGLWRGVVGVLGSLQHRYMLDAMNADAGRRDDLLAMAKGVGAALSALDGARKRTWKEVEV